MLRIKELRDQKRLNQEGLAIAINVSQSTISAYEIGDRKPDLDTLLSIAKFFNVSLDYLAGLTDIKQTVIKSELAPDEVELIRLYQKLATIDKEKVKAYLDGLLSR